MRSGWKNAPRDVTGLLCEHEDLWRALRSASWRQPPPAVLDVIGQIDRRGLLANRPCLRARARVWVPALCSMFVLRSLFSSGSWLSALPREADDTALALHQHSAALSAVRCGVEALCSQRAQAWPRPHAEATWKRQQRFKLEEPPHTFKRRS